MEETKKILKADYELVNACLTVMTPADKGYDELLKDRDSIRKEMIEISKIELESENKKETEEKEDKKEKIRNMITVGTFVASSLIGIWTVVKTFKFDSEATITSTLGRGVLNSFIPKIKK